MLLPCAADKPDPAIPAASCGDEGLTINMAKFYITTPIYYVNARPHLGHAYTSVLADALARYHRLKGDEVFFLTGTDEHGQKVERSAKAAAQSPQRFTDELSQAFRNLTPALNLTNDDFIRTTEDRHKLGARELWRRAKKSGDIFKKKYAGLYCVGHESFISEKDLMDGQCPEHLTAPEKMSAENYFFALSKYTPLIKEYYARHKNFVIPEAKRNEMQAILNDGLEDISISRETSQTSWGVPVPDDDTQVMYVWFDALTNYLTALGFPDESAPLFKKFWPTDVHLVGKEINRFHSLLWPAMLISAGLTLPEHILVHGWITVDGQKMSKTIGNVVDPFELVKNYGADTVRYFFCRELVIQNDGDFSYVKIEERYRADLSHELGNLVQRTLTMVEKYANGKTPPPSHGEAAPYLESYQNAMTIFALDQALAKVWEFLASLDKAIEEMKPWVTVKKDPAAVNALLYRLLESLRLAAIMIAPVMPETAQKIWTALGLSTLRPESAILKWGGLKEGTPIKKGVPLFPALNK
ncbi:MAG: methionyl-tRNA synthetase [Candidatus Magasanikbacteria bacterium]|nr:methionyl-tRNA synthetase [Candidatus Magasanikbacteria bacterium]